MTAKTSISSNQRPRDFMAKALRSMWGSEPGTPKRPVDGDHPPAADSRDATAKA